MLTVRAAKLNNAHPFCNDIPFLELLATERLRRGVHVVRAVSEGSRKARIMFLTKVITQKTAKDSLSRDSIGSSQVLFFGGCVAWMPSRD
jgi:hypothetical protein